MSAELGGREVTEVAVSHAVDVDARTGAASVRIDVPCTPGRGGFGPSLALVYAGSGLGSPFGLGWNLSGLPAIGIDVRRREKTINRRGYPKDFSWSNGDSLRLCSAVSWVGSAQ
jgi:hypothetical protein